MKSFFKFTFASIIGFIIAGLLFVFLFFGIIGSMVSSKEEPVSIKDNSILKMTLSEAIVDRASSSPFDDIDFFNQKVKKSLGLNVILKNIKKAKEDEHIKGIYINTLGVSSGLANLEEIREALIDFKTSGKFIISYSDIYTQSSYYLSSISDKIYLNPEGSVDFKGLSAQLMFFKKALDNIGVNPIIIRGKNNKFKSAVEPYMYEHISDANYEQTSTYLKSIWNHFLKGISESRSISVEQLNNIANNLLIRNAQSTVDLKLVDAVKYDDEVNAELRELSGLEADKDLRFVSISKYNKVPESKTGKGLIKNKIAVIYAAGGIDMGNSEKGKIGGEGLSKTIRKARKDSTVKAIVLRVNSPGGSALASELIWREMVLAKQVKPVVVSMGNVAASGGYYISAPSDKIYASPVTITGSIGVFGLMWNGSKILKGIGINVDAVNTNKYSDVGNMARPMSDYEYAVIQEGVEDVYHTFLSHVAEGRHTTVEAVDKIGQGRVWSGENALEIGLIDEFGGLNKAIEGAKELAKLEEYKIVEYPKKEDSFKAVFKELGLDMKASLIQEELGDSYIYYDRLNKVRKIQGVQMRMPFEVEIR